MENMKIVGICKTWQEYSEKEAELAHFMPVVKSVLEEGLENKEFAIKVQQFYAELVHWIKFALKDLSLELILMLKAYQQCLEKNIYNSEKFEEVSRVLVKTLMNISECKHIENRFEVFLETFNTLIYTSDCIFFFTIFHDHEEILEQVSLSVLTTVAKINNPILSKNFISIFGKILKKGYGKSFTNIFLGKKCVRPIMKLTKQAAKGETMKVALRVLEFYVKDYNGLLSDLNLSKIYREILKVNGGQFVVEQCSKILFKKLKDPKSKQNALELKRIILILGLSKQVNKKHSLAILKKLQKKNYLQHNLSKDFKSEIKILILGAKNLKEKIEYLELIYPWIIEGINVIEYKLLVRLCKVHRHLTLKILTCLLEATKHSSVHSNYYKIYIDKPIHIDFDLNLNKTKEFSIWTKIYKKYSTDNLYIDVKLNSSIIFSLALEESNLKIQIVKGKNRIALLTATVSMNTSKWNMIGLNFSLVAGKCKLVTHFNSLSFEIRVKEISAYKELNSVKVYGKAWMEFIKIFSEIIYEGIFCKSDYKAYSKGLIFSLDTRENFFSSVGYKLNCKAEVVRNLSVFEVICIAGSLNVFLPILRECDDSKCFSLFFHILTEFSEFEKFQNIFSSESMMVLSRILGEKKVLVDMEWLDSIEGFLASIKNREYYMDALECFYLCYQLWSNLKDHWFMFYLEAIKTHFFSHNFLLELNAMKKIIEFYICLSECVDPTCKKLIFFYFFQVSLNFVKKSEEKIQILVEILKPIFCDVDIKSILEEFSIFLKELIQEKWQLENDQDLFHLFSILQMSLFQEQPQITSLSLALCLKATKSLFFTKIIHASTDIQIDFINKFKNSINIVTIPSLHPEITQEFTNFLSKPKISESPLKTIISILTESLIDTAKSDPGLCSKNMQILIPAARFSVSLSRLFCCHKTFPGWVFEFYSNKILLSEIQTLVISIFSHLSLFKVFDFHRILVFELIKQRNFPEIFKFFIDFYLGCLTSTVHEKNKMKYLLEFFNLVEDTINRIDYKDIPVQDYSEFIEICVLPMNFINFSKSFPILPGFTSYAILEKSKNFIYKSSITLRDGGLARQLLRLIFIGMSFYPNPKFEHFLSIFSQEKLKAEENRIEWKDLTQGDDVQRIGITNKSNQVSCKNLICLYIFHEWAVVIRRYVELGFSEIDITKSVSNLHFYSKQMEIEKKIIIEGKILLDRKSFRWFDKVRDENLDKMRSAYHENSQNEFEGLMRKVYSSQTFTNIAKFEDNRQNQDFYRFLLEFANSLDQARQTKEFSLILKQYWQNLEIQSFFIVLTSLKITLLSSLFFFKAPQYSPQNSRKSVPNIQKILPQLSNKSQSFTMPNEFKFQFEYKKIVKNLEAFTGTFPDHEGKLFISNSTDLVGRRLFIKSKLNRERKYCSDSENTILDSFDVCSRSFSIETFNESEIFVENPEEKYFSLDDFQDIIYNISDPNTIIEYECEKITPYGNLSGKFIIYDNYIVFQGNNKIKTSNIMTVMENGKEIIFTSAPKETQILKKCVKIWKASDIEEIATRKFIQNLCAIEIFFRSGKVVFFSFFTKTQLIKVHSTLKAKYSQLGINFYPTKKFFEFKEKWKHGKISNFQYLMILNKYSGRSFNDIGQHPIFPWVLSDYTSSLLDLKPESSFRNFNFPICGQSILQQNICNETFKLSKEHQNVSYHCGTHYLPYSTVLNYLIRIEPYTSESLDLYKGNFDVPDRIFSSVIRTWQDLFKSQNSVKELIPEFFYLPEMFLNSNNEDFGETQEGHVVNNVKLPKWANGSVYLFLIKHQKALESEFVSKNLNNWIDLIFGYKQKNTPAIENFNVFNPVTYSENFRKIFLQVPNNDKKSYLYQAMYFGQCPSQLFSYPHCQREECEIKPSIFERLLSKTRYEFSKKCISMKDFMILCSENFLILLKVQEKIIMTKFRWALQGVFDLNSAKEIELASAYPSRTFLAVLYEDSYIVSAGYNDCSLVVHDMFGALISTYKYHSISPCCLLGGNWVISAASDSTLIALEKNELIKLYGHVDGIVSVAGIYESCIIASCSKYILLHNSRTGQVLNKINIKCSKIMSNTLGYFFAHVKNEIRVLFLNGRTVKSVKHCKSKVFLPYQEFLVCEDREFIRVFNCFEDGYEALIHMQESVEIVQVVYYAERNVLLLVNASENFTLFSLDLFEDQLTDLRIY